MFLSFRLCAPNRFQSCLWFTDSMENRETLWRAFLLIHRSPKSEQKKNTCAWFAKPLQSWRAVSVRRSLVVPPSTQNEHRGGSTATGPMKPGCVENKTASKHTRTKNKLIPCPSHRINYGLLRRVVTLIIPPPGTSSIAVSSSSALYVSLELVSTAVC